MKGTFSLKGNHNFDINKKTFKDKVINCFLSLPDRKADMKSLVEKYINIYGKMEGISILTEERRKVSVYLFRQSKQVFQNPYQDMTSLINHHQKLYTGSFS